MKNEEEKILNKTEGLEKVLYRFFVCTFNNIENARIFALEVEDTFIITYSLALVNGLLKTFGKANYYVLHSVLITRDNAYVVFEYPTKIKGKKIRLIFDVFFEENYNLK